MTKDNALNAYKFAIENKYEKTAKDILKRHPEFEEVKEVIKSKVKK